MGQQGLRLWLAAFFFLSACATIGAPVEPGPPPETTRLGKPEDLAFLRARSAGAGGRIVYIGVYRGPSSPWGRARHFISPESAPYTKLSPEDDLRPSGLHDSLM